MERICEKECMERICEKEQHITCLTRESWKALSVIRSICQTPSIFCGGGCIIKLNSLRYSPNARAGTALGYPLQK